MKNSTPSSHLFLLPFLFAALIVFNASSVLAQQKATKDAAKKPEAKETKEAPPAAATKTNTTTTEAAKTEEEKINKRIVDNIRAAFNVPPNIEMSVESRGPSKVQGLDSVIVKVRDGANSNNQEVLLSKDSKYALVARILTLVDDPYAETMKKINLTNAPALGNKDAKVTIVEYSDFQCPFCSQAYRTIENDVLKQYGDKVKIVYKNFPLPIHPWAESAAVAGLCAFSQGNDAFWTLYRGFFESQSSITADNVKAKSMEFAGNAKIDTKKFEECYEKKETLPQVKAEMSEAQQLGLTGTPLFIINGHSLPGVQPFSSFQKVIDEELKKASN